MKSWIKIDREITSHWIFDDPWKFRNWIDLLTLVNHTEQKINIKGVILTCKRGETLCSLDSFAKRWNCDKSKVRRFFKLLESDSMIELKSEHITTRLTICKYDTYQSARNGDETQVKRKRNANETELTPNNNEKKEKNEKESLNTILSDSITIQNFDFKKSLISFGVPESIASDWMKVRKNKKATNTETALKRILTQISKANISPKQAIELCVEKSWSGFESDWYENLKQQTTKKVNYDDQFRKADGSIDHEAKRQAFVDRVLGRDKQENAIEKFGNTQDISFIDVTGSKSIS